MTRGHEQHPRRAGRSRPSSPAGFSIVELLVVVSIILIVMGLVTVAIDQSQNVASTSKTHATVNALMGVVNEYEAVMGSVLPTGVNSTGLFVDEAKKLQSCEQMFRNFGDDYDTSTVWKGVWLSSTSYLVNQTVARNGVDYVCIQDNNNRDPSVSANASYWKLWAPVKDDWGNGIIFRNDLANGRIRFVSLGPDYKPGKSGIDDDGANGIDDFPTASSIGGELGKGDDISSAKFEGTGP